MYAPYSSIADGMRQLKRSTSAAEESNSLGPPPAKRSCYQPSPPRSPSVLSRLGSKLSSAVSYLRDMVTGWLHSPPPHPPPDTPDTTPALTLASETSPWECCPLSHVPHPPPPPPLPRAPPTPPAIGDQRSNLPLKDTMMFESPRKPRALREMQAAREQKMYQQILDSRHRSTSTLPALTPPPRTPALHTPILHLHPEVIGPSSPTSTGSPDEEKPLPSHSTPSHSYPPSFTPAPHGGHMSRWSAPSRGSRRVVAGGRREGPGSRRVVAGGRREGPGSRQVVAGGQREGPGSRQVVAGGRREGPGSRQVVAGGWRDSADSRKAVTSRAVPASSRGTITAEWPASSRGTITAERPASSRGTITAEWPASSRGTITAERPASSRRTITAERPASSRGTITAEWPASSRGTITAEWPVLVVRGGGPSHPPRRAGSWIVSTDRAHPSAGWPHALPVAGESRGMQTVVPGAGVSPQRLPGATPSPLSLERWSEATQLRQWLEGLQIEHRHAIEDHQAALEVTEKYLHLYREERMRAEEARVCRLRENLCRITLGPEEEEEGQPEMLLILSVEQEKKVAQAMASGQGGDLLSERFRIRITRADVASLSHHAWLNDEIINFYFNLIAERSAARGQKEVHVLSSFFYPKLTQSGHSGVRRWTKKVDIFSKALLLLPIHLGMHWCLAVVDFSQRQFRYYDSLKGRNLSCLRRLREYIIAEALDKKDIHYDLSEWADCFPQDIPEQLNGSDCGVFTCMYARHLASDTPFTFSQHDMPSIRLHMMCEILEQRLF